jgi:hypothetical protein
MALQFCSKCYYESKFPPNMPAQDATTAEVVTWLASSDPARYYGSLPRWTGWVDWSGHHLQNQGLDDVLKGLAGFVGLVSGAVVYLAEWIMFCRGVWMNSLLLYPEEGGNMSSLCTNK